MEKCAILIVDDEPIILISLKRELQGAFGDEFDYEKALSAEEAEDLVEELVGDGVKLVLIISDWLMPGIKGDEFLRRVHARHPAIKTMIVSGHADNAAIQRARDEAELGAYVSKPWDGAELIAEIRRLLGRA